MFLIFKSDAATLVPLARLILTRRLALLFRAAHVKATNQKKTFFFLSETENIS